MEQHCSSFNAVRAFTFLAMLFAAATLLTAVFWAFKGAASLKIPVVVLGGVSGKFSSK